jgi:hypothetical protein
MAEIHYIFPICNLFSKSSMINDSLKKNPWVDINNKKSCIDLKSQRETNYKNRPT